MTYISKPNFAYLRETTHTSITMCGACHTDRLMFLDKHMFPERHRHTDGVPQTGRINSGEMKRDNAALLIHNGANEAALAMGGDVVTYEPPRTRIVDPVGMGDVVAAELFAGLMTGDTGPNRLLEGALDAGVTFASSAFGDGR